MLHPRFAVHLSFPPFDLEGRLYESGTLFMPLSADLRIVVPLAAHSRDFDALAIILKCVGV